MPNPAHAFNHASRATSTALKKLPSPYNFVPLNEKVYRPNWGFQVSQDLPFAKGVSGILEYILHADTEILVAGDKDPTAQHARFHQLGGEYSIPGSTIRGMLRAIIEVITCGKMANIDEQRPALRDISGTRVSAAYTSKLGQ
ncbi:MAG: RAMP superfamily CRISPR-associated protein, partial [Candidatus Igneacidithiobacillus chanchocoensis]